MQKLPIQLSVVTTILVPILTLQLQQFSECLKIKSLIFFLAGPAFQAGRYTVACGTICKAVKEKFGVPVVTSMNEETPGVDMFKKICIS